MKPLLAKIWKIFDFTKNVQLFLMRFLQDSFLIGVTGVILNNDNEVLLFRHTYRQHAWSLPGGYLKKGEHPKEGLEREIKEESGLIISADDQLKTRTDRDGARLDICYVGKYLGGEFKPSSEVSEYGFFTINNMPLLRKNQLFLIDEAIAQKRQSTTS